MADAAPRLTALAHGGGCGCKLSPALLRDLLSTLPAFPCHELLVGTETGDDAAVYRLNESQALVATTDFFTPIVDDPFEFGRIAATNALSDVYAMGGTPILALALLGMPLGRIDTATVKQILEGGASVCAAAGIPVAGGHSIDSQEPIYGLVALGLVHPDRVLRNSGARVGDALLLTKPLGVGIFSAALKRDELSATDYATMLSSTTRLNSIGRELPDIVGVHAATDVTGFGLLGHLLEIARGSQLGAALSIPDVPILPGAQALARAGVTTGAAARNWDSFADSVRLPDGLPGWSRAILCDPQTSGGLLIAIDPAEAPALIARLHDTGHLPAIIGHLMDGPPIVTVT